MASGEPVLLGPWYDDSPPGGGLTTVAEEATQLAGADLGKVLDWSSTAAAAVPLPGGGQTLRRWEWLATVAAADLTLARSVEPHLDALAILAEASRGALARPGTTWGVFAAEGPGTRLSARQPGDGSWQLDGVKPWCSLAGSLSHALVTAWVDDEHRAMFAVDLRDPGVAVDSSSWRPAGLSEVATARVTMHDVPAEPVGVPGWYLHRPGFAWGGIGVAAVWFGGAVGLLRRLRTAAGARVPDQVALMHLGAADADLAAAGSMLQSSAASIDHAGRQAAPVAPQAAAVLASRTRHAVHDAAERVLTRVGHSLGPAPLAHEPTHVRRVSDLTLYLRQHHAERDSAALGSLLLEASADPARTPADPDRGPRS